MNEMPSWYVVYTKPRWEKKVAELLGKRKFEHYCPLNKVQRQWHDRKKIIEEPLFTSYVFLRVFPSDITEVRKTPGVVSFVYWLGRPAVVRDEEIQTIKDFLDEFGTVTLEKTEVNVQDRVKIINGPLVNKEGNVIEIMKQNVKVSLPTLGYSLTAIVEKTSIELVERFREPYQQKVAYNGLSIG